MPESQAQRAVRPVWLRAAVQVREPEQAPEPRQVVRRVWPRVEEPERARGPELSPVALQAWPQAERQAREPLGPVLQPAQESWRVE